MRDLFDGNLKNHLSIFQGTDSNIQEELLLKLAETLDRLHKLKIVVGDLQPNNIAVKVGGNL